MRLTVREGASRHVALAILLIYAAATLYVGLHHEPWRDEADSWLVVRDTSLAKIVTWTRNAGTPALWYVLLEPLVRLGLPFPSQELLHLALAWTAAAILLLRAPFPWVTKVLVLASYYFAYEYAVIARSYVLTVLLSFLIAAWYSSRHQRPTRYAIAIALLFNANVHGALIAGVLVLLFVLDGRSARISRPALVVMLAGALAAWAQLRTAPDAAYPHIVRQIQWDAPWRAVASAFLPGIPLIAGGIGAVLLLVLLAAALRRHGDALLFLGLSLVALNALFVFVWFGGYRHAGLLLLCAIVALWMAGDVRDGALATAAAIAFNTALVVSAIFATRMAVADVRMAFSGGMEMGRFIHDNRLDRYEIAAHNIQESEAVLPWIPDKPLWYAALGRYGTYMEWNREEEIGRQMPYALAVRRAVVHFAPRGAPWLMLLNAPIANPASDGFRLIHETRPLVFRHREERYWLYVWTGPPTR